MRSIIFIHRTHSMKNHTVVNRSMRHLFVIVFFLVVSLICISGAGADSGSNETRLLFENFCAQLGSVRIKSFADPVQQAIWDETSRYLSSRFGYRKVGEVIIPSSSKLEDVLTWNITTLQGKHKRKISVTWERKKGKLKIIIIGNASGRALGEAKVEVGKYVETIEVDVVETQSTKGVQAFKTVLSKEVLERPGKLSIRVAGRGDRKPTVEPGKVEKHSGKNIKKVKASNYALRLFKGFCSEVNTLRPSIRDKVHRAIWEDTSRYLAQSNPGEVSSVVKLPASAELEGEPKWSTKSLLGKHERELFITWDREKGKLYVDISGDAAGEQLGSDKVPVGEYQEDIEIDVCEESDEEGNINLVLGKTKQQLDAEDVETENVTVFDLKESPEEIAEKTPGLYIPSGRQSSSVGIFARECDDKGFLTRNNQVDLNGTWESNKGKWIISHTPLRCKNPQAKISLINVDERGHRTHFDGVIEDWRIIAKHIVDDPEDMTTPKPYKIRKMLADAKKYPYNINLKIRHSKDNGIVLDGVWRGLLVRWSPEFMTINWVGPGYQNPLTLVREENENEYRIVKIKIDDSGWRKKLGSLKSRISNLEDELSRQENDLAYYRKRLEEALKNVEVAKDSLEEKAKEMATIETSMTKLRDRLYEEDLLPDNPSKHLLSLLKWRDSTRLDIKFASDKKKIADLKRQLAAIENLIKAEYSKAGFDPEKERPRLQAELDRLEERWKKVMGEYWEIKIKKLDHAQHEAKFASKKCRKLLKRINEIEDELVDLRQKYSKLDERDTPFVDEIVINDEGGKQEGKWVAWAPFEAIKDIDDRLRRLRKEIIKAKEARMKARREHEKAFEEASEALDRVSKAIMNSAYLQAVIESGYYFYDVFAKGWSKGGPFGALTEALGKAAESLIFNQGGIKFAEANPEELRKRLNDNAALSVSASDAVRELDLHSIGSKAYKRLLKESYFKIGKTITNQQVMMRVNNYLVDHMREKLIRGIAEGMAEESLEQLSKRLVKYNTYLDNLMQPKEIDLKLTNLAKGVLKDFSKSILKNWAKGIEEEAWLDYFKKDIMTRSFYDLRRRTDNIYWELRKRYEIWREAKKLLTENYDPESGFKGPGPFPIKEGDTYFIKLKLRNPEGRREKIYIGGVEADPVGNRDSHFFIFEASGFEKGLKKSLVLRIDFLE